MIIYPDSYAQAEPRGQGDMGASEARDGGPEIREGSKKLSKQIPLSPSLQHL